VIWAALQWPAHERLQTLDRKVVEDAASPTTTRRAAGAVRRRGYLEPHRAYVREIQASRSRRGAGDGAHHGRRVVGNLPRALGGLGVELDAGFMVRAGRSFGLIRSLGNVPEDEMRRVFNLGVGFCAVVAPRESEGRIAT
jgi:phosphoribosylformylglycinamidine cyclo-ligase